MVGLECLGLCGEFWWMFKFWAECLSVLPESCARLKEDGVVEDVREDRKVHQDTTGSLNLAVWKIPEYGQWSVE